jgi:hypothetical protein
MGAVLAAPDWADRSKRLAIDFSGRTFRRIAPDVAQAFVGEGSRSVKKRRSR